MDAATPCRCPRCGWLGTIHDAEAYQPLAHLEPLNICPRCATETEVQPLGQKGLDGVVSENGQQSTVSKPALPLSCSHIATTIEPLKPSREMTMSTADTYVRARIDTSTKERAADALEAMGLSISDAIRLLMLRIADERRMPFDVKAPNATTRKAIAELEAGKGKRFASVDDLMADLHADD